MNKEFVPYEQALALKELGFDEPCFAGYRDSEWIGTDGPNSRYFHAQLFSNHQFDEDEQGYCSSPLFGQAFRWFREKYNISSFVKREFKDTKMTGYYHGIEDTEKDFYSKNYITYEEAELECLKKLIEIVKNE